MQHGKAITLIKKQKEKESKKGKGSVGGLGLIAILNKVVRGRSDKEKALFEGKDKKRRGNHA